MVFAALFGNPTIEKILFFLLVNEKCYASQLRHCLGGALTPIQHALSRLEGGGILTSHLEGKTRLFRLNSHYPCYKQLEALVKQGYTQLPLGEQKRYYCPQAIVTRTLKDKEALPRLWEQLGKVKSLSFTAQSKAEKSSGWNGDGKAQVHVKIVSSHQVIFVEEGVWVAEDGNPFDFKNTIRWTWHLTRGLISLEHLRHGIDHPVLLFELNPVTTSRFETLHPYLCRQDTYLAQLSRERNAIKLNWRILGPRKNEEIQYLYT